MKLTKTYDLASFKALDDGPGRFEAVVSVFGSVDLQGDRVMPGAFQKTLKKWRSSGAPVPIVWSHQWLAPEAFIGEADPSEIQEVTSSIGEKGTGGLLIRGKIDVQKPFAAQVFDLLVAKRIKEWSWAYDVGREKMAVDGANELHEVDLIEAGPCLKGAHPDTFTISAKSAMEKELEEAYEAQRSLTKFLTLVRTVEDPDISRVLAKTYVAGVAPALPVPPGLKPDGGGSFSLLEEDIKKALGLENESDEPKIDESRAATAATKAWHIEERDGEFCVIKDDDDEVAGCHEMREGAEEQLRALNANESSDELEEAKNIVESEETKNSTTSEGNYTVTVPDFTVTVPVRLVEGPTEQKVDSAASALKEALIAAVDGFVKSVNDPATATGDDEEVEEKSDDVAEKSDDVMVDIKARLDALGA